MPAGGARRTISGDPQEEVKTMLVKDVMTEQVVTIAPSASLKDAARLMLEHGISGIPVVEEGRVVGVLSDRDFLVKEQGPLEPSRWLAWLTDPVTMVDEAKLQAHTVRGAMTVPAITVWKSASLAFAAQRMLSSDVSRLPVLDGDQLVGIVTRTDLVRAFTRTNEEIEREINEEVFGQQLWVDRGDLRVSVANGNVDVEGRRPEGVDDELLRKLVARVPGVVSVLLRE
jgi:CBS domain-containing protein